LDYLASSGSKQDASGWFLVWVSFELKAPTRPEVGKAEFDSQHGVLGTYMPGHTVVSPAQRKKKRFSPCPLLSDTRYLAKVSVRRMEICVQQIGCFY